MSTKKRPGPTPLKAVALSAVWPGLGHFGHRNRRGAILVVLSLFGVAAAVIWVSQRTVGEILAWGVNMTSLRIVVAASACSLAIRWLVAVDAWRLACRQYELRKGRRMSMKATVLFVALAVGISAPHVIAIRLATVHMGMLPEVFRVDVPRVAVPTVTPTAFPIPTPPTSTLPAPPDALPLPSMTRPRDGHQPNPATVPPPPATSPPTTESALTVPPPPATVPETPTTHIAPTTLPMGPPEAIAPNVTNGSPFDNIERLTLALLGSDAGFDRYGVRTDTIVVLTMDVATGDAAAFSVPRNWYRMPFPNGTPAAEQWPDGYTGIANEIYALGLSHPQLFPGDDPPGLAIKSAMAQLTGLNIHYYLMVDMVGFVKLVDLFGGVEVYVTESIKDRIKPVVPDGPHLTINVTPGTHHFDGSTALGYVRSRTQSSDWRRMTRQRCIIGAFVDQVAPLEILYRYEPLTNIITDHITTDIPLEHLAHLVVLADRLDTSHFTTVAFVPPEFPSGNAPVEQVRRTVADTINPERSQPVGTAFPDACGPAS